MRKSLQLTTALALALAFGTERASARSLGIDSDFNCCSVNWSQVAGAGVQFACIKATQQSAGFQNNVFGNRMQGAQAAGIYTMPYNRVSPSSYTPASEAAYFWNFARPYIKAGGYNLSPAVDIEDGLSGSYKKDGGGTQTLVAWINQYYSDLVSYAAADGISIQKLAYVNVGITCTIGNGGLNGYLWLANPCGCDPQSGSPYTCAGCSDSRGWDGCTPIGSQSWSIWQYKWSSQMSSPPYPGLSERVDLNVYNGTISQMASTFGTAPTFSGVAFKPSAICYADGRGAVFALQYTGYAPWCAINNDTNPGTSWTGSWLGNNNQFKGSSAIVPVICANGYMNIFAIDTAGQHFMNAWNTGEGTTWSAWAQVGASTYTGNPSVVIRPDGGVECFVHTSGGSIAHFYRGTFASSWGSDSLGGTLASDPTGIVNANNYMQVFATDASGNLVNRWNTGPGTSWNSGSWTAITGGSNCSGRPAAVVRSDGGVEVFVRRASDGVVKHFYHGSFGATWGNDTLNSGVTFGSNLAAVENAGALHQMEVFGITAAGNLWYVSNGGPGQPWGNWAQITTGTVLTCEPCAMVNSNGSVEVFARIASNNNLGHTWNTGPGSTSWSTFSAFGGPQ